MRMVNFNKVIKVLNIKSAVSLQWTPVGSAIETTHYNFVKFNHPHVIFYKRVILNMLFKNI